VINEEERRDETREKVDKGKKMRSRDEEERR
jgi:hypothetical protein